MGSGGTYGAGVGGGVNDRLSAAGGTAALAGGVNFIGSMIVCPVDWSWSTSQSLSSSSTGGQTSDGAVLSSVGIAVSSAFGRGSSADAERSGRRGLGVRRPASRIRVGRRSLSHRRPRFHSDTVLVLSQGARAGRHGPARPLHD